MATTTTYKFCDADCQANPNGCVHCGRTGLAVGARIPGTVVTLSGGRVAAYRECVSVNGRLHKPEWAIRLANARNVAGAGALRSFQPR